MSEFHLIQTVQAPLPGPTQCYFCHDFAGPFINTNTEVPGYGGVYICAPNDNRPGCIGQMAQLAGYVDSQQLIDLATAMESHLAETADLQAELDELRQLKEISAIVRKRQERRLNPNGDDSTATKPRQPKTSRLASYASTVTFNPGGAIGKRP